MYAIALLDYRHDTTAATASASASSSLLAALPSVGCVSTAAGIARMRRHFQSIGRYSPGAFLYPIYGVGELPQAFARLCAVQGGIYILRYQPSCVVSEMGADGQPRVKGLVSDGRQLITAEVLVCDREYVDADSDEAASTAAADVSCAVCVVDARVLSGAGDALDDLTQCVFPPLSVHDNQHPVRLIQLGASVKAAPEGQYVLYLYTPSTAAAASAAHDLQPIIDYLTQRPTEQPPPAATDRAVARKPSLLHAFYYKRKQRTAVIPAADTSPTSSAPRADSPHTARSSAPSSPFHHCRNVLVTADSSPLLSFDSHLDAAQLMLDRLAPGVSLLAALTAERSADSGGGDEEKQQLEQLNILNSVIGPTVTVTGSGVDEEDEAVATVAESESKEHRSAAPPSIRPLTSEQPQQEQQEQRREQQAEPIGPCSRNVPATASRRGCSAEPIG